MAFIMQHTQTQTPTFKITSALGWKEKKIRLNVLRQYLGELFHKQGPELSDVTHSELFIWYWCLHTLSRKSIDKKTYIIGIICLGCKRHFSLIHSFDFFLQKARLHCGSLCCPLSPGLKEQSAALSVFVTLPKFEPH